MKNQFFAFVKPTQQEYKQIWSDCAFCFDANILLNFYRYKGETTNEFFELLEKLKSRIFLTYQASAEYFRNRLDVISEQEKAYSDLRDSIKKNVEDPLQHQRKHPYISSELLEEFLKVSEKLKTDLDTRSKEYSQRLSDDEVLDRILEIFDAKVSEEYDEDRLLTIYTEGDKRYNENIPPGFKDKHKGGVRQYGDLVLWFQIMDYAKENDKDIVFITDDEKEDWLYFHKGRTIGLLPELQNEFQKNTGKKIYIYNAQKFYEYASQLLDTDLNEETLEEIRILREENKILEDKEEILQSQKQISEEEINKYVVQAIRATTGDNGWSDLASLGIYLLKYTPINYRNFGFSSLKKFIESRQFLESSVVQKSPNAKNVDTVFVRFKEMENFAYLN